MADQAASISKQADGRADSGRRVVVGCPSSEQLLFMVQAQVLGDTDGQTEAGLRGTDRPSSQLAAVHVQRSVDQ